MKDNFDTNEGFMSDGYLAKKWRGLIGTPDNYVYTPKSKLIHKLSTPDFDADLFEQTNGPGTIQQTLLMLPKVYTGKLPAVAVPFYYPDKVAGYDLNSLEPLTDRGAALGLHLVRRGYAVITAQSYHLTYIQSELDINDFYRWQLAGDKLNHNHPKWTGIGKLIADTQLTIDLLFTDPRIDSDRIGIAGHSLGGKVAFYTGCLDPRIKAILTSDFGIGWEMSNWEKPWYWGRKFTSLINTSTEHWELLKASGLKPFVLIAGECDTDLSLDYIKRASYSASDYLFINHATGHRPPLDVLERGYDFLADKF